jgi:hypothetical protein
MEPELKSVVRSASVTTLATADRLTGCGLSVKADGIAALVVLLQGVACDYKGWVLSHHHHVKRFIGGSGKFGRPVLDGAREELSETLAVLARERWLRLCTLSGVLLSG